MESDTVSTAEIITQITSQGNAEKTFENDTFLFCRRGMKSQRSNDEFFGEEFNRQSTAPVVNLIFTILHI